MNELFKPTLDEMAAEIERELALRRNLYPRWVETKKISRLRAERQIAVLEAVAALLLSEQRRRTSVP